MASLREFDVELSLTDSRACEEAARDLAIIVKPNWLKEDIHFEVFTVGITNKIFSAGVSDTDKLIFRVFGKNTEKVIDRPHELQSWALLASRGLAAELYGKFKNGLLCGYLPGKSLSSAEVRDEYIKKEICRAMAHMHNIPVTDGAEPCVIPKTKEFLKNLILPFTNSEQQAKFESYFVKSLEDEVADMIQKVLASGEDLAFCHNDLLVHNILFNKGDGKVAFIDYEYADFNYALFDIANHFNEYAGVDNADYSLCADTASKKEFITEYLVQRFGKVDAALLERMCKNVPLFEAASHLFWAVWALVQAQNSLIEFDYLEYAILRHQQYRNRMEKFMKNVA